MGQVCQSISAVGLVDDNLNHVMACSTGNPSFPTVLFGNYEWNKRRSGSTSKLDQMSYNERLLLEKEVGWWKREDVYELPVLIRRCSRWEKIEEVLNELNI